MSRESMRFSKMDFDERIELTKIKFKIQNSKKRDDEKEPKNVNLKIYDEYEEIANEVLNKINDSSLNQS